MSISWGWVVCFCLILFGSSIYVRKSLGIEITTNDIIVLVLPFLLWLLASGKIIALDVAGLSIKTAFSEAGNQKIQNQVNKIDVQKVTTGEKSAPDHLQDLLNRQIEALSLHIGNYYDAAILQEYIKRLTAQPTFRWIIVSDAEMKYVGSFDMQGRGRNIVDDSAALQQLTDILNGRQPASRLVELPGFIGIAYAVNANADKQAALTKMEDLGVSWLAVIGTDEKFAGIVDRGRLTTSLILDVERLLRSTPSPR